MVFGCFCSFLRVLDFCCFGGYFCFGCSCGFWVFVNFALSGRFSCSRVWTVFDLLVCVGCRPSGCLLCVGWYNIGFTILRMV